MANQAFLSKTTDELSVIGGVGDFSSQHDPIAVSESVAAQYDTDEMRELGWVVTWTDADAPPASLFSAPTPPAETTEPPQ